MKNVCILLALTAVIGLSSCKDTLAPAVQTNPGGLVAWYKLDQNTADSSGNNHTGVAQGGTFVPDRFGGAQSALKLDAQSQSFVSVLDAPDLNFDSLSSFTISVWIKTTDTSSNYVGIISKGPAAGTLPGYAIGLQAGKALATISGDRNPAIRSNISVNDGNWHLLTLTIAANVGAALYVDGYAENAFPPTTFYANRNNTAFLFIGKDRTSSDFFTGVVDDIRIYSKWLAPGDVIALYSAGGWFGDTTKHPIDTTGNGGGGTFGANTLDNPSFQTSYTGNGQIDASTFPPWDVAYSGSGWPRFGTGNSADTIPGYAYLWGTVDDGNAIWQPLSTPIKKGHTYKVSAYLKMATADLHNTRYVNVRFVAFNQNPGGLHWQASSGQVSPIGTINVTNLDVWQQFFTGEWTADADYANFEIDAATLASGPDNVSWVSIDKVELHEKN